MSYFLTFPAANIFLAVSVSLSMAFVVYGLNTVHLTMRAKGYSPLACGQLLTRPSVAVHLPIYNELYVVPRLLDSCVKMANHYGKELVSIYVIDDSTDETSAKIDGLVEKFTAAGFTFRVIRRGSRTGFKAGALQSALEQTEAEYVAVLDADFVPPADFLDRALPHLQEDNSVGFVQSRWGYLDRGYNLITESMAIGIDAHFLIEQQGRNGSGYLMNFNGSAGVLRTQAIRRAGGWNSDTLAEDLDLSYRMQLAGYKGVYMNDLEVPGELPPTIAGLKRQQGRWARGSVQTAKKLLGPIRRSDKLTFGQKIEAGVHLTYYLVHPLMVASFLLAVATTFLDIDVIRYAVNVSIPSLVSGQSLLAVLTLPSLVFVSVQVAPWAVFSVLIALSTVAVLYYCVEAIRVQKLGLLENTKEILLLVVLGYGISISNSVQALSGLFSKNTGTFMRTPKYAITSTTETWREKKYQLPLNMTSVFEAGGVALACLAIINAFLSNNIGIIPILVIYLSGYALVLSLTLKQALTSAGRSDN
ncbi:MAG: glycosyltransferase [Thaumarchaeota archaeon]|nr:glycosyltransferase [Nitrososphaerota archaeon]